MEAELSPLQVVVDVLVSVVISFFLLLLLLLFLFLFLPLSRFSAFGWFKDIMKVLGLRLRGGDGLWEGETY